MGKLLGVGKKWLTGKVNRRPQLSGRQPLKLIPINNMTMINDDLVRKKNGLVGKLLEVQV